MRQDKAVKYLQLARHFAELFSKDPSTKVGAIFLAPESLQVLTMGYNGMPRGIDEKKMHRWERPQKYKYVTHAEQNCIANACRHGTPLEGCIAVVTMFPCCDCARSLIQAGVKTLVTETPNWSCERWGSDFKTSLEMFQEVGTKLMLIPQSDLQSKQTVNTVEYGKYRTRYQL